MSFYQLFSDEPKDKVSVLNKQKQMTLDAKSLSFEEWNNKWGSMDAEDTKAFMPGRVYQGKDTYKMFKSDDPKYYDQRIASEQKRIDRAKKEEDLLNADAMQKAGFLKTYIQNKSTLDKLSAEVPTKYGYTPGEEVDPVAYMSENMIAEAEGRIKNKQGIGLTGDSKNEMVCIKGVCTLLANQGVDFKGAFSDPKYKEGVDIDEQGRMIPQYNPFFSEAYEKAGFQKLAKGEKPKKGDLAQYYQDGKPKHMEMVMGSDKNFLETFNNYDLYNSKNEEGAGRSRRFMDEQGNAQGWEETAFYRIKPETASAALSKNEDYQRRVKGKQAFESSEDFKLLENASKFVQQNKDANVLGDDQGLVQDIIKGVSSGGKYEDVIKSVIPKAKNAKLVERVIKNLYQ